MERRWATVAISLLIKISMSARLAAIPRSAAIEGSSDRERPERRPGRDRAHEDGFELGEHNVYQSCSLRPIFGDVDAHPVSPARSRTWLTPLFVVAGQAREIVGQAFR